MLDALDRRPLSVFAAGRVMGDLHAAMHERVAPTDLPALREVLAERIAVADALPDDLRSRVLSLLDDLPTGDRLCHGDMHIGNILGTVDVLVVDRLGRRHPWRALGDLAGSGSSCASAPSPGAPRLARALAPVGRRIILARYLRTYRAARPVDDACSPAGRLSAPWRAVGPGPEDTPPCSRTSRSHRPRHRTLTQRPPCRRRRLAAASCWSKIVARVSSHGVPFDVPGGTTHQQEEARCGSW